MTVEAAWLDPITLEILWSRLISMLDEADTTLLRTSYSPIVGEAHDYACCLMDSEGKPAGGGQYDPASLRRHPQQDRQDFPPAVSS